MAGSTPRNYEKYNSKKKKKKREGTVATTSSIRCYVFP